MNFKKGIIVSLTILILLNLVNIHLEAQGLKSSWELDSNSTTTYTDCISYYHKLALSSKYISIHDAGYSDVSYPIQTVIISKHKEKNAADCAKHHKTIVLINNGIHPGEPDGIDACMILARNIISKTDLTKLLDHVTIVIIPIYNIGGSLHRNSTTRAYQNGPTEYGFRANAQYLDLNRDFIKCDSRNAQTFTRIFHQWSPHLFIDTHTTDGADYPYNMTLINTQESKLNTALRNCMLQKILPNIHQMMKNLNDEIVPYVDFEDSPNNGIYAFDDLPRFSSGYAALHHSIAFITESHMLKSHRQRVRSHINILTAFIKTAAQFHQEINQAKQQSELEEKSKQNYFLQWKINEQLSDSMHFDAFKIETPLSKYLNTTYTWYNRNNIEHLTIPYYHEYEGSVPISKPKYYIIPQAYYPVIDRLRANGVTLLTLDRDSLIQGVFYKIVDYKTVKESYENHYLHSNVQLDRINMTRRYYRGDIMIPMGYKTDRFVIETMEPQAPDSYFNWNFFDGVLMRKEYFSDYIFTHQLDHIMEQEPKLKEDFLTKKSVDSSFSRNTAAQLHYIYTNSKWSEANYRIYPVARIE